MRKVRLSVAACATLLWAGIALATVTPKQHCDNAGITAWKVYTSCIDSAVAKDAKGVIFDRDGDLPAAFARIVRNSSADRLRELARPRRHAALVCFLWQSCRDAVANAPLRGACL